MTLQTKQKPVRFQDDKKKKKIKVELTQLDKAQVRGIYRSTVLYTSLSPNNFKLVAPVTCAEC